MTIEIHLDSVDSTNNYAKTHGTSFDPEKITCVIAEEQTTGRGRHQRHWVSPRGVNLYVTFYFRLPQNLSDLTAVGQVMGCSLASLLTREGINPKVKWPNDIQIGGKKVCGILSETVFHANFVEMIVGVGINVNMDEEALDAIDQPATSLKKETGRLWDRKAFLKKLQMQFQRDLETFRREGFSPFRETLEKLLAYKGEEITVFDGTHTWKGICHCLTPTGGLTLLLKDNTRKTIMAGDVKSSSQRTL